jgi:hypothetical protein
MVQGIFALTSPTLQHQSYIGRHSKIELLPNTSNLDSWCPRGNLAFQDLKNKADTQVAEQAPSSSLLISVRKGVKLHRYFQSEFLLYRRVLSVQWKVT